MGGSLFAHQACVQQEKWYVSTEGLKADVKPCLVCYAFDKAALTTGHIPWFYLSKPQPLVVTEVKLEFKGGVLEC